MASPARQIDDAVQVDHRVGDSLAINDNRDEAELRALLQQYNAPHGDDFTWLEKIVTDGDTSFYLGQYARVNERMDEYREVMGDFFPEFEDLYRDKETFLSALTLRRPLWPTELEIGGVLSFETTDLDGNQVRSEELFAESKVTMLNLWGTWCAPCKGELPELARLAKEMDGPELAVTVDLHLGAFSSTIYTCDFSLDYVHINADYTT